MRLLSCACFAIVTGIGTGCTDELHAQSAPGSDAALSMRTGSTGISHHIDASVDGVLSDASSDGALDGVLPLGCFLTDTAGANRATLTASGLTQPFPGTRAFAMWDCSTPTLLIGLSANSCSPDASQRIVIAIRRDQIGASVIQGPNILQAAPFDEALRLTLVTQDSLNVSLDAGTPINSIRGTCNGASGDLTFDNLDTTPGSRVSGRFNAVLTDCRLPQSLASISVDAVFDVTVQTTFGVGCP